MAEIEETLDVADLYDLHPCPACGGIPFILGWLGRLLHLRCRDCGIDYSTSAEA